MLQAEKSDFKIVQHISVVIELLPWTAGSSESAAAWFSLLAFSANTKLKVPAYMAQGSSRWDN